MKKRQRNITYLVSIVFLLCIAFCGCDNANVFNPENVPLSPSANTNTEGDSSVNTVPSVSGTRDNTSNVLVPEASGITVHSTDTVILDVSNSCEGYIMAEYTGTNQKVKLQIKGPDDITYTYNLHGTGYEVFPLTAGDGSYTVGVYENISGTKYSLALSADINVTISNTFGPYLYPNQYVNFTADSLPVAQGALLAKPANSDLEVVEQVYNYIIENFTYDYDKAKTVVSGYLPVVDEVFTSRTGICFDYAAVMATMLRSQTIPTRLEVGYVGEEYHAWISVYIEDIGWINGIIEFDGTNWNLMDPTFASTSKTPKKFIAKDNKYLTKYVY